MGKHAQRKVGKPSLEAVVGEGSSRLIDMPEAGGVRWAELYGTKVTREGGHQPLPAQDSQDRCWTGKETKK